MIVVLKGKKPFFPYSSFTPGTPGYTHYTPARQRYSPLGKLIPKTKHYHKKSSQDEYLKNWWLLLMHFYWVPFFFLTNRKELYFVVCCLLSVSKTRSKKTSSCHTQAEDNNGRCMQISVVLLPIHTPNLQIFFSALQINCKTLSLAIRLPLKETSFVFFCQNVLQNSIFNNTRTKNHIQ